MLDDVQGRLDSLDASFDEGATTAALDELLTNGHGALRRERTDPLIGLLGAQLVELIADPALGTAGRDAHPSGHRRRDGRRHECEGCFDEGYALGRIALDTHELALLHSPLSTVDGAMLRTVPAASAPPAGRDRTAFGALDQERVAGFARLRALRGLVLRDETSRAFLGTEHLAPFVRTRAERRRPAEVSAAIDPALGAQLTGLGTMAAICEWSMLLGDDTPSAEILRLR